MITICCLLQFAQFWLLCFDQSHVVVFCGTAVTDYVA